MKREAIKSSIELFVFDFGYVPLDIRVQLNNGSYGIHFSIFKNTNVTLKDCSMVTVAVRDFLVSLLGNDDFTLDVSSPGAERVLKNPFEYRLFEGKTANLLLNDGTEKKVVLKGCSEDEACIEYEDRETNVLCSVPFSHVCKCQLTLE